jgi:stage II sporulation protein D
VSEFVFIGRGWGHGVGMCQVGAYGLAKQGFSAEQIIKTYYTGVELTRMY